MSRITEYFRKDDQSSERPTSSLPDGFDNPQSDYFIPDELRPYFSSNRTQTLRQQDPNDLARRAARDIAMRDAKDAVGQAPSVEDVSDELDPVSRSIAENLGAREYRRYAQTVREDARARGEELLENEFGRMLEIGLHLADVDDARKLHNHATAAERRRNVWESQNTCPLCGECEPTQNGHVEFRALNQNAHWASPARLSLRSCLTCFIAASMEYAVQRSKESCTNGVRADLVRTTVLNLLGS